MKRILAALSVIIVCVQISAQETKPGIAFSGYVKNDFFYDSRKVEAFREGHFLLYPSGLSKDKDGKDVNAQPSFNFLSIQTRLTGKITGPDAFGAKTSGMIESEFFGTSDADVNGLRLRHAFVKLNWTKSEIMFGQFWNPFFATDCFPDVVSVNTGAPFQPFSRNPQIRYTYSLNPISLWAAVVSERDFTSMGPDPAAGGKAKSGSEFLRNSGIPEAFAGIKFAKTNDEKGTGIWAGLSGEFKMLKPRQKTDSNFVDKTTVQSMAAQAYLKVKIPAVTVKLEGVFGQNLTNMLMLGGYAVEWDTTFASKKTDARNYTTLDNMSAWLDVHTNGQTFQFGVFGGFSKNLGSTKNIQGYGTDEKYYYARGRNIAQIYRVSPRLVFNSGKFRMALEGEYTVASYGSKINSLGEVSDLKDYANLRILLGVFYFF